MNPENKAKFDIEYQAGKTAFERGDYATSVKRLEIACALIKPNSRLGGEAQMWLVTAYEAAGKREEGIALCQQLSRHPDSETRKQGKRLLYILQAPQLQRPEEWMVKIPDLGGIADRETQYRPSNNSTINSNRDRQKLVIPDAIDLTQVNTKDNQFIWVALILIIFLTGVLIWFGM
ncbi:MAG TPA: hypothetical protein DEG17_06645 [Cyanobacteria bacterium UBA11149]|nr:hypothetical protein [Cyanobacteria bacterium UBA11367]HBE59199.1 hypothetical protein [Cyanobacteria bacterium UBA11366]HBK64478.1 hypothetical protein [Cyanobacteria bacterium UBA11166]HBR73562.1 hypothetical protein [Cyanobacteria bacterium UBA11159]HBS69345.1 hypothetical protein [Cyanobacteria bacterium UBA11153]HBW88553.1 hypothetical protein [Cyanobacteria bacterium UBA11149]HCA98266.1 hypothetical protein [Cyanobacteria bacterium UBA9226]